MALKRPAVYGDAVEGGDEGCDGEAGEEAGADGLGGRLAEGRRHGEDGAGCAEDGELLRPPRGMEFSSSVFFSWGVGERARDIRGSYQYPVYQL